MSTNQEAIRKATELIRKTETSTGQPDLLAYADPLTKADPYTIGFGFTYYPDKNGKPASKVKKGDRITADQAWEYLELMVADHERSLAQKVIGWEKLNENQQAAIISFAWNLGLGFYGHNNFRTITKLIASVADSQKTSAAEVSRVFGLYINPGTNVTEGLRIRREKEAKLFSEPPQTNLNQPPQPPQTMSTNPKLPAIGKATISFLNMMKYYEGKSHQKEALQLADKLFTGQLFMTQVSLLWRNGTASIPVISLFSAAESWKGLPHQEKAMQLLDKELAKSKINLAPVSACWRSANPNGTTLNVPYISQYQATRDPSRMCNVTSVAMILAYREQILGKPYTAAQLAGLPDQLDKELAAAGKDRYTHSNLDWLLERHGVRNTFDVNRSWDQIRAHLDAGSPVIFSGQFTRSGHIVVITGYDKTEQTWIVNDPNGLWRPSGRYDTTIGAGKGVKYSYASLDKINYGPNKAWAHLPNLNGAS